MASIDSNPLSAFVANKRALTESDLLLSDRSMPRLGDTQLLKKTRGSRPEISVVISTRYEGMLLEDREKIGPILS